MIYDSSSVPTTVDDLTCESYDSDKFPKKIKLIVQVVRVRWFHLRSWFYFNRAIIIRRDSFFSRSTSSSSTSRLTKICLRDLMCDARRLLGCLFLIKRFERAIKLRVAMCKFFPEWILYDCRRSSHSIYTSSSSLNHLGMQESLSAGGDATTISSPSYFIIALFIQVPKLNPRLYSNLSNFFTRREVTERTTDKECRKKSEAMSPTHTYTSTTLTRPSIYEQFSLLRAILFSQIWSLFSLASIFHPLINTNKNLPHLAILAMAILLFCCRRRLSSADEAIKLFGKKARLSRFKWWMDAFRVFGVMP